VCAAGAKLVAVGCWGVDDLLGNHGATIRMISGRQLYRESIPGVARSDQDEGKRWTVRNALSDETALCATVWYGCCAKGRSPNGRCCSATPCTRPFV